LRNGAVRGSLLLSYGAILAGKIRICNSSLRFSARSAVAFPFSQHRLTIACDFAGEDFFSKCGRLSL
ncbi:MAG: hypothetical protein AB7F23_06345, partial [Phycisphaerae bacterium]